MFFIFKAAGCQQVLRAMRLSAQPPFFPNLAPEQYAAMGATNKPGWNTFSNTVVLFFDSTLLGKRRPTQPCTVSAAPRHQAGVPSLRPLNY